MTWRKEIFSPNSHGTLGKNHFIFFPGTEEARRVESEIYDKLYGNHLSLVGWYHSSPKEHNNSIIFCYEKHQSLTEMKTLKVFISFFWLIQYTFFATFFSFFYFIAFSYNLLELILEKLASMV